MEHNSKIAKLAAMTPEELEEYYRKQIPNEGFYGNDHYTALKASTEKAIAEYKKRDTMTPEERAAYNAKKKSEYNAIQASVAAATRAGKERHMQILERRGLPTNWVARNKLEQEMSITIRFFTELIEKFRERVQKPYNTLQFKFSAPKFSDAQNAVIKQATTLENLLTKLKNEYNNQTYTMQLYDEVKEAATKFFEDGSVQFPANGEFRRVGRIWKNKDSSGLQIMFSTVPEWFVPQAERTGFIKLRSAPTSTSASVQIGPINADGMRGLLLPSQKPSQKGGKRARKTKHRSRSSRSRKTHKRRN